MVLFGSGHDSWYDDLALIVCATAFEAPHITPEA